MKNMLKLGLVVCGFALATVATSIEAQAGPDGAPGGCVSNGVCGTTSSGTELNGKWRE